MYIIYMLLEGEREYWYLNKKMDFGQVLYQFVLNSNLMYSRFVSYCLIICLIVSGGYVCLYVICGWYCLDVWFRYMQEVLFI